MRARCEFSRTIRSSSSDSGSGLRVKCGSPSVLPPPLPCLDLASSPPPAPLWVVSQGAARAFARTHVGGPMTANATMGGRALTTHAVNSAQTALIAARARGAEARMQEGHAEMGLTAVPSTHTAAPARPPFCAQPPRPRSLSHPRPSVRAALPRGPVAGRAEAAGSLGNLLYRGLWEPLRSHVLSSRCWCWVSLHFQVGRHKAQHPVRRVDVLWRDRRRAAGLHSRIHSTRPLPERVRNAEGRRPRSI